MNRKTIKIKLDNRNMVKLDKLEESYQLVNHVASEYLSFKEEQLKSKDFTANYNDIYKDYRKRYPTLNSVVLQQTFRSCDEIVKSRISWCKKKHRIVNFSTDINMPIILRDTNVKVSTNIDSFEAWLSLWRTKFPLRLCDYHMKLLERSTRCVGSKITRTTNGSFILNLSLEFEPKTRTIDGEVKVLGCDLGVAQPIACSDGKRIGSGKLVRFKKTEYSKKRGRNQRYCSNITEQQRLWTKDYNHKISRELVNHCLKNDIDVLCLENLKGHKLSNRKYRKLPWAFKELLEFVKYKAEIEGIEVVDVDPAYTSQMCSYCGHVSKENRKTQSLFHCVECGHNENADTNGTKNIRNSRL